VGIARDCRDGEGTLLQIPVVPQHDTLPML
jgi:hypothetical protein